MRQLDIEELEAVAAIAEVRKRGAVMLVSPGGRHITIFPRQKIPPSLHTRISRHFAPIRSILLSLSSHTR
jgi:hypothetical protein